jgi:hypothetical protein
MNRDNSEHGHMKITDVQMVSDSSRNSLGQVDQRGISVGLARWTNVISSGNFRKVSEFAKR